MNTGTKTPKLEIVMLPTDKKTLISKLVEGDLLYNEPIGICQHLYLVSDNLLNIGDWVYDVDDRGVFQFKNPSGLYFCGELKKVEATTDFLLKKPEHAFSSIIGYVPQIPKSFIEKFVKLNGKIKKVNVEMEIDEEWLKENPPFSAPYPKAKYNINTDSNNNVIIL